MTRPHLSTGSGWAGSPVNTALHLGASPTERARPRRASYRRLGPRPLRPRLPGGAARAVREAGHSGGHRTAHAPPLQPRLHVCPAGPGTPRTWDRAGTDTGLGTGLRAGNSPPGQESIEPRRCFWSKNCQKRPGHRASALPGPAACCQGSWTQRHRIS